MKFEEIDPNRFVILKTGEKAIVVERKDKDHVTVSVDLKQRTISADDIEKNDDSPYSQRRFWEPLYGKVVGHIEFSPEMREANKKRLDELISKLEIS